MQQETEILVGRVENVSYESEDNGFAVLQLLDEEGELISVVGPLAGSVPGEELTLRGKYSIHASYGPQFQAEACAFRLPQEADDILQYLSSGVLPGIGPVTARRIVERFGADTLGILAQEPEKLAEVSGFSLKKAKKAGQVFLERYGTREAMMSLMRLGLSMSEAVSLYGYYEKETIHLVESNPYRLCGHPLFLGFARVDAIAQHFAFEAECEERVQAALLYTLRHNLQNGHTCLPAVRLQETVTTFFKLPPDVVTRELERLCDDERLCLTEDSEKKVFLPEMMRAEMNAAAILQSKVRCDVPMPKQFDKLIGQQEESAEVQYAERQIEAIRLAMQCGVVVITGGPGTGKTTAINAVISLLEQQAERVLLAAPTGRAAKRMSELTARKASTIHRLLEVDFRAGMDTPRFKHNAQNPLRCDVLIVDEVSMVDALLFESLLLALKPSCRLILVGDVDQLPSVGAGNVLRGILQSGSVPSVRLNEIFRQAEASLIVRNAHEIMQGNPVREGGKNDDFFFLRAAGLKAQDLICDLVARRLSTFYNLSPFSDIQVLCPGRKGPLGTEVLSAALQERLNPKKPNKQELKRQGFVFREGDKVMQVKNNYDIPWTRLDGEAGAGAYNGDIGLIESIDARAGTMTVLCEDRRVTYIQENLHELELAYAITIHKSQGSEFEAVVLSVAEVPKPLRYRNLLYTGVTRAKNLCVLVGEQAVLDQMVANANKNTRFSHFDIFLQDEGWL